MGPSWVASLVMGSVAMTVTEIETGIGTETEMDTGMDTGIETEIATGTTTGRGSLYERMFSNFRLVFCPSSSDQFPTPKLQGSR